MFMKNQNSGFHQKNTIYLNEIAYKQVLQE